MHDSTLQHGRHKKMINPLGIHHFEKTQAVMLALSSRYCLGKGRLKSWEKREDKRWKKAGEKDDMEKRSRLSQS